MHLRCLEPLENEMTVDGQTTCTIWYGLFVVRPAESIGKGGLHVTPANPNPAAALPAARCCSALQLGSFFLHRSTRQPGSSLSLKEVAAVQRRLPLRITVSIVVSR